MARARQSQQSEYNQESQAVSRSHRTRLDKETPLSAYKNRHPKIVQEALPARTRSHPVASSRDGCTRALAANIVEANLVNVARQGIDSNGEKPRHRDRVLDEGEIRRSWRALDHLEPILAATFKMRLLTAQRGTEVLHLRWETIADGW